ncbi:hypothetical protein CK203_115919 [Vitis vinifera]|uniref:Uncharacterized protein n=1 Tax=Vitis vinifera TaxID=29760 RepID=A0A438CBT8_VITVI|nr:hypothetical protein CK203_115919 [Vitis vinifera]
MAKTRRGLSASPSSPTPRPHQAAMGGAASPTVQAPAIPPSEGEVPSQRRYPTRRSPTDPVPPADQAASSVSRPPEKRTKFSGPGEPSHAPRPEPPTEDSRIPMDIPPETVIRRPMIAGPPIEGNLDCRDRSFHSETYFDIEALRQQPELRDSFRLLQRYHMENLLTPRQFYYPRVVIDFYQSMTTQGLRNPTLIQFTIDGRQGAIGARHIAEALRIPYEPVIQADFREWSSFSQSDMVRILSRGTSTASVLARRELPSGMLLIDVLLRANLFPLQHKVQRRGAILEALFRISEGYFFGPHHLIMTSLLHFEEKVHQKKLQRAYGIPLLFPRLLCQILEHLGYPEQPRLERRRHCREDFSLDKWHHLVAYFAPEGAPAVPAPPELPQDEQLPQAQQDEILTDTTPPAPAAHTSMHMPEAIHPSSPLTQAVPPVMPATPVPPPSSEPTVTVSLTEFRGLVRSLQTLGTAQDSIIHQMATIRAHQDQIIATQAQHTTILHQIQ